jgi:hypothetical protein
MTSREHALSAESRNQAASIAPSASAIQRSASSQADSSMIEKCHLQSSARERGGPRSPDRADSHATHFFHGQFGADVLLRSPPALL